MDKLADDTMSRKKKGKAISCLSPVEFPADVTPT